MSQVRRSALVPYTAGQMFELVNDIERYPEFLPWCSDARIVVAAPQVIDATLTIVNGRIRESFTTRNVATTPDAIEMSLLDGPFRRLAGAWRFTNLGENSAAGGSKVELALEFEMSKSLLTKALGGVFARATGTMVDAFCTRARAIYGG